MNFISLHLQAHSLGLEQPLRHYSMLDIWQTVEKRYAMWKKLLMVFRIAYQYAVETGDCITYAGIPMYERKPMQELLKMDYEYFVLDMGSMKQEQFLSTLFFDSRVKRVIVAGAKPQEWIHTKTARANVLCRDAAYIISFASNEDIVGISSSFANPPLFAAWIPDMFARDQEDLKAGYGYLFSEDRKKKKSVSESDTGKHRKHSRSSRAGRTS